MFDYSWIPETKPKSRLVTGWKVFLVLVLIGTAFMLNGCVSPDFEQSIGVGPEDNAILRIETHVDPAWSESSADYCRTEFPKGFDIKTLTPEQLEAATRC